MTFDYQRPRTLQEASQMLDDDGAVALSGGTDLLVGIRHRRLAPTRVVDLKGVADIGDRIATDSERLRIDGRVTMGQITTDDDIRTLFPALAESASVVGSVQIRNRATLAGNLCNGSPAADTAPALLAYDAVVMISRHLGRREVPVSGFFVGPGKTVLERGDVVTGIEIPIPVAAVGSAFARVTRRRGVDLASVSVACTVDRTGVVKYGFGAVGPTPLAARTDVDQLSTDEGWEHLLSVTTPISDIRAGADYRVAMLRVHSKRAFEAARSRLGDRT